MKGTEKHRLPYGEGFGTLTWKLQVQGRGDFPIDQAITNLEKRIQRRLNSEPRRPRTQFRADELYELLGGDSRD